MNYPVQFYSESEKRMAYYFTLKFLQGESIYAISERERITQVKVRNMIRYILFSVIEHITVICAVSPEGGRFNHRYCEDKNLYTSLNAFLLHPDYWEKWSRIVMSAALQNNHDKEIPNKIKEENAILFAYFKCISELPVNIKS